MDAFMRGGAVQHATMFVKQVQKPTQTSELFLMR